MRNILAIMVTVVLGIAAISAGVIPTTVERDAHFAGDSCLSCTGVSPVGCDYFLKPGCAGTFKICDLGTSSKECDGAGTEPCTASPGVDCYQDAKCE